MRIIDEFKNLFKGAGWALTGRGGVVVTRGIYMILLARTLGVEDLGLFTGILALIHLLLPFLGMGSDSLLIKHISRDPKSYSGSLFSSLIYYLVSGVVLSLVLYIINAFLLDDPFTMYLFLSLVGAEFLFKLANMTGRVFQAFELMLGASVMWFLTSFTRLAALLLFLIFEGQGIEVWSLWYFGGALVITIILFGVILMRFGKISSGISGSTGAMSVKRGFAFAFSESMDNTYSDADKFLLLKMASEKSAGLYSAAYQFVKLADLPVRALLNTTFAAFFRQGKQGVYSSVSFAKKLLPYTMAIGFIMSWGLFVTAPLVPWILGESYTDSVNILRWLAIVPLLQAMYRVIADALSGAGKQVLRVKVQVVAVIVNVGLNLVLIPIYSWNGAIVATLISEFFLLATFVFIGLYFLKQPAKK